MINIEKENFKRINKLLLNLENEFKRRNEAGIEIRSKYKNNIKDEYDIINFFKEKIDRDVNIKINIDSYFLIIKEAMLLDKDRKKLIYNLEFLRKEYVLKNPLLDLNSELISLGLPCYFTALEILNNKSNEFNLDKTKLESIKNSIKSIIDILEEKDQKEKKESEIIREKYQELNYLEKRNEYLNKRDSNLNISDKDKLKLYKEYENMFNRASKKYTKYVNTFAKEKGYNSYFVYKYRDEKLGEEIIKNIDIFYTKNKTLIDNVFEENISNLEKHLNNNKNYVYIDEKKIKEILLNALYIFKAQDIKDTLNKLTIIYSDKNTPQRCIILKNEYVLVIKVEKENVKCNLNGLIHEFSHAVLANIYEKNNKKTPNKIIQETIAILSEIIYFENEVRDNINIENIYEDINTYFYRLFDLCIKPINLIIDTYKMEKEDIDVTYKNIQTYINYFIQPYMMFTHFFATVLSINVFLKNKSKINNKELIEVFVNNNEKDLKSALQNLDINIESEEIFENALKYILDIQNINK